MFAYRGAKKTMALGTFQIGMNKRRSVPGEAGAHYAYKRNAKIPHAFSALLICVGLVLCGFAQRVPAASSKTAAYQIWSVVIRADGTPLFAASSETGKVLHQFRKGHVVTFQTSVDAPPPWDGEQWIYYPLEGREREGINVPVGWLRRQDILIPSDFKAAKKWPIRYLIHDAEFYQYLYRFNLDGSGKVTHHDNENKIGEMFGPIHVYLGNGIAVSGSPVGAPRSERNVGVVLGIYDEKSQCIYGVYHREPNCDKYRDPRYGGDLAQALFSEPPKPVFFWDHCVVDCDPNTKPARQSPQQSRQGK